MGYFVSQLWCFSSICIFTLSLSLTGNGSARGCGGHGTPLQAQGDSSAGSRVPGEGSRLSHLEGVAIGGDIERISLAVGSGNGSQSSDGERGKETHD